MVSLPIDHHSGYKIIVFILVENIDLTETTTNKLFLNCVSKV
jgi:hypothetical protein